VVKVEIKRREHEGVMWRRGSFASFTTVSPGLSHEHLAPVRRQEDRALLGNSEAVMKRLIGSVVFVVLAATVASAETWNFDAYPVNAPPPGFSFGRTGKGKEGRWVVQAEKDAPSAGNVLAQLDTDTTDYRFPVAVANEPKLGDVSLSVRCKPVSGRVDQACGVVFRYQDENNYYLTRANALEDNVNLYYVKDGKRRQITGWRGKVTSGSWHQLGVEARGDHFVVSFDGNKVIDAHDSTFSQPGKVGVWTKADSVTYFDDLSAAPLR